MKIKKHLKFWPELTRKLYFYYLIKSSPRYQPIFKDGKILGGADRGCLDRWELIKSEIKNFQVQSFLDLGCAEGFYVLSSAKEFNIFSLGVDADIRRLSIAQNQLITEDAMSAGFTLADINLDFINQLPNFDIVVFMSVLHHFMYLKGPDYCRDFLSKLRTKISKVMIFEMGQSDELENEWARQLPDMGNDPHQWIKDFLLSAGFSKVAKIGESDSFRKDKNRGIFRAEP